MIIGDPRFVLLDTATLAEAARKPNDAKVKNLVSILRRGDWIPFITFHHLEELACHGSYDVFRRRFDFLSDLPHLAFLKKPGPGDTVGDAVYVRDYEIEYLVAHQAATHAEIIEGVRPKVRSGFCTGEEFARENFQWWEFFHRNLAGETRRQKAEIVNLTHFPVDRKSRIPARNEPTKTRPEAEAALRFAKMAVWLEQRILRDGDCREKIDPRVSAKKIMREAFEEARQAVASGGGFDALLRTHGVERDRLPKNACTEDFGHEAVFVAQLGIHARRLLINKAELLPLVREEQLPSWVLWQELDRRIKQLQKAEIGNLNDKHIVAFGPYVDVLNVDKRTADALRRCGQNTALALSVYKRVPKGRGLPGLLEALQK